MDRSGNILSSRPAQVRESGVSRTDEAELGGAEGGVRRVLRAESVHPFQYAMVDTMFMLVDVHLFCQLVDFKDAHPGALEQSYAQIAKACSASGRPVPLRRRDQGPAAASAGYVAPSPRLAQMLGQLRASEAGFLLTNSLYDYTRWSAPCWMSGGSTTSTLSSAGRKPAF